MAPLQGTTPWTNWCPFARPAPSTTTTSVFWCVWSALAISTKSKRWTSTLQVSLEPLNTDVELQDPQTMRKAMDLARAYDRRAIIITDSSTTPASPTRPTGRSTPKQGIQHQQPINACNVYTDFCYSCFTAAHNKTAHTRGDCRSPPCRIVLQLRWVVHSRPQEQISVQNHCHEQLRPRGS